MAEVVDARYGSWNRRLARAVCRPFVGSELTPNHITTLRVLTGFGACGLFAYGGPTAANWAGVLWVLSAFLDRCDGEFARLTGLSSRRGHLYDITGDITINAAVFAAVGIGLTVSGGDWWPLTIGVLAAAGIAIASILAEFNEQDMGQGQKTFSGGLGFDFDDLIYVIALFPWIGQLELLLICGSIGGPLAAIVIGWKLIRKKMMSRQS